MNNYALMVLVYKINVKNQAEKRQNQGLPDLNKHKKSHEYSENFLYIRVGGRYV